MISYGKQTIEMLNVKAIANKDCKNRLDLLFETVLPSPFSIFILLPVLHCYTELKKLPEILVSYPSELIIMVDFNMHMDIPNNASQKF